MIQVALDIPELLREMHTVVTRLGLHPSALSFRYDSPDTATWFLGYPMMERAPMQAKIEAEIRRAIPGQQPAKIVRITGPIFTPAGPPTAR